MAFWQDRNEKKNGALLYGPWVSYFLSHQIVNFSTFRIYCKLTFQEIPKSWKSKFPFPTKLETIGGQSMPGHVPTIDLLLMGIFHA